MTKHTQAIRRQFADELFECVQPFCGIGAQSVNMQYLRPCLGMVFLCRF